MAAGIFGTEALGGRGGVSFFSQLIVTIGVLIFTLVASTAVYGLLKKTVGIRLQPQQEILGSDISIHRIETNPEEAF